MLRTPCHQRHCLGLSLILLVLVCSTSGTRVFPQNPQESERDRALRLLWGEAKTTAALPLLGKLVKEKPDDGILAFSYGFALIGKVKILKDAEARRQLRVEARSWLLKAQQLGVKEAILTSLLEHLPPDGGPDEI